MSATPQHEYPPKIQHVDEIVDPDCGSFAVTDYAIVDAQNEPAHSVIEFLDQHADVPVRSREEKGKARDSTVGGDFDAEYLLTIPPSTESPFVKHRKQSQNRCSADFAGSYLQPLSSGVFENSLTRRRPAARAKPLTRVDPLGNHLVDGVLDRFDRKQKEALKRFEHEWKDLDESVFGPGNIVDEDDRMPLQAVAALARHFAQKQSQFVEDLDRLLRDENLEHYGLADVFENGAQYVRGTPGVRGVNLAQARFTLDAAIAGEAVEWLRCSVRQKAARVDDALTDVLKSNEQYRLAVRRSLKQVRERAYLEGCEAAAAESQSESESSGEGRAINDGDSKVPEDTRALFRWARDRGWQQHDTGSHSRDQGTQTEVEELGKRGFWHLL